MFGGATIRGAMLSRSLAKACSLEPEVRPGVFRSQDRTWNMLPRTAIGSMAPNALTPETMPPASSWGHAQVSHVGSSTMDEIASPSLIPMDISRGVLCNENQRNEGKGGAANRLFGRDCIKRRAMGRTSQVPCRLRTDLLAFGLIA